MEQDMAKQNFNFYCQQKKGGNQLELYELPMVLSACGYKVSDATMNILQDYLANERKSVKLDF